MVPVPQYGDQVKDPTTGAVVGTAAYDPNTGNPLTPPADTSSSTYVPRYTNAEPTVAPTPQSADQIQAASLRDAQGEIDSLNQYYADLTADQQKTNEQDARSTNAISTLTGLAGSTEANVQAKKTQEAGAQALKKIGDEHQVRVQSLLGDIRKSAIDQERQQRLDYNQSTKDNIEIRKANAEQALGYLKNLGASGVTLDGLKAHDPKSYQYLADQFGGEAGLRGAFVLNTPQDQILDKQIKNGKYIIAKQNPITGKTTVETLDLGLPDDYTKTVDAGDRILAIPEGWDGDPSKLISIHKGLTPKESQDNGYTVDENGNVIQTGNYDSLTIGRYNKAANAATAILQKNPTFKNIIGSSAYLDRIEAAVNNPGSVGDQELLDAFTQLNTGGNRVTEAQVHLITNNQSLADATQKWANKLKTGGALSNDQRTEIVKLAHEVYANYQKSYKPLYEDATSRLKAQGIPKQFWNIPDPSTLSRSVSDGSGDAGSSAPSQVEYQGKIYNVDAQGNMTPA